MQESTVINLNVESKVALVKSASYGIGFAITKAMASVGATIVFNDIKQDLVDKGLASYAADGITAHGYICDVTDEDAVQQMIHKIEQEVGTIDILVNNAGIIKRIPMLEISAKNFRQVMVIILRTKHVHDGGSIPNSVSTPFGVQI